MNKHDRQHRANIDRYQKQIDKIYEDAANEAARLMSLIGDVDPDREFSIDDFPAAKKRAEKLFNELRSNVQATIIDGVSDEWDLSNTKNNLIVTSILGNHLTKKQSERYLSTNESARDAFIERREQGLKLSDRVWNYSNQFKAEIEQVLDVGIRTGMDAEQMQRELKQYLKSPDNFYRRFQYKVGEKTLLDENKNPVIDPVTGKEVTAPVWGKKWKKRYWDEDAQGYRWQDVDLNDPQHRPGAGVYRSSRMNARRLAATETNMAYRTADHERWQQLDFVVGIHIECSALNHVVPDICDTLAGDYPKDFKWTGWHPHCRCHATSILKTDEELDRDAELMDAGQEPSDESVNAVTKLPKDFTDWVEQNEKSILDPEKSTPYFVRDNWDDVRQILHIGTNPKTALVIAEERHLQRTPIEEQAIRDAWAERNRDPRTVAANRHANRTPEREQAIRDAWSKHNQEIENIRTSANNVLNLAKDYGEVDFSQLESLVSAGKVNGLQSAYKDVGQQILKAKKFEQSISDIIPDAHDWHKQFTSAELQTAHTAIQIKLDSMAHKTVHQQIDQLTKTEIPFFVDNWIMKSKGVPSQTAIPTWKVAVAAYTKKVEALQSQIFFEDASSKLAAFQAYKTKSKPFIEIVAQLDAAIARGDKNATISLLSDAQNKYDALEKRRDSSVVVKKTTFKPEDYSQVRKDAAPWAKTFHEANDELHYTAEELWKFITKGAKEAFDGYTGGSAYITEPLRSIPGHYYDDWRGTQGVNIKKHIDALTKTLNKCAINKDIWIKRDDAPWQVEYCFGIPSLSAYKSNPSALVGLMGVDDSFMSCGSHKGARFTATGRKDVIYNIYCPKGTKGCYVAPFSVCDVNSGSAGFDGTSKIPYSLENEFLLQRGSKLRITKAEYNTSIDVVKEYGGPMWFIDVEIVEQAPRKYKLIQQGGVYHCEY